MLGTPYLLPGLIVALIMCSFKNYYQAIVFMIGVVYCADDTTFYVMAFLCLVFTIFAHLRAVFTAD